METFCVSCKKKLWQEKSTFIKNQKLNKFNNI